MIKTFLVIAVFHSQTGEVVKLIDPVPGFATLKECQEALKLVPTHKGIYRYRAWCLTPSDISI